MDTAPPSLESSHRVPDNDARPASADELLLIARATNDTVWDLDLHGDLRRHIEGFRSHLPEPSALLPVTKDTWLSRIHTDDRDRVGSGLDRILASEESLWREEYRLRRQDGGYTDVLDSGFIIRDADGHPMRMVGGTRDISEIKRLIEQEHKANRMDSIGMLAGGIAHDLNNILAPVLMAVGLLRESDTRANDLRLLDIIEANLKRGGNLLRQILSFARDSSGLRTVIRVDRLVAEITNIIEETFPRSIQIIKPMAPDLWQVFGDVAQIHQIVLNLAVNARDAMPGGGTLTLSARNVTIDSPGTTAVLAGTIAPGRYVLLETTDTGVGIPEEIRERIFEPFFTTNTSGKGTGLGLANVDAFVKNHGGFISVESEPGHGTTFKVYLPAAEQNQVPVSRSKTPLGLKRGNDELVLVVDDEASVLRIVQQTLEVFGYRVLTARDGAEALAVYTERHHEIALVLTDSDMPTMGGQEEIQTLLKINPAVKIVVTSGLGTNDKIAGLREVPANRLLSKPFTIEALLQMVHLTLTEQPSS